MFLPWLRVLNCSQLVLVSFETEEAEEEHLQLDRLCEFQCPTIMKCEQLQRPPKVLDLVMFLADIQIANAQA
ncbi:hypothetical protein SCA6_018159 [Theobroma cacao]